MLHIKNVLVCDGSGQPPFQGEILVQGEKIVEVRPWKGEGLGRVDAQVMDGEGKVAVPGFIDAHRHCDIAALTDPAFGEIELAQGITTAVMGNCGLAPTPCTQEGWQERMDFLEPCLGKAPPGFFYPKVSHYLEALVQRSYPLHLGVLAATGAMLATVKRYSSQPTTAAQRQKAISLAEDAFSAGALGLSCGIMYPPECDCPPEDFLALAKVAAKSGTYLTAHIRGEGNSLATSVKEVLELGERAELPVNISHLKVTGLKNHGHGLEQALTLMEQARARGRDVTADAYPYTGGSTTILSLVPPSVVAQGGKDLPGFLGTERGILLFGEEIQKDFSNWDNMVFSIGWERIIISSTVKPSPYTGQSFAQAAEQEKRTPEAFFCALLEENGGKVGVILMSMSQQDVDRVLTVPWVSLISDGLYGGGDFPHPRLYGAFPKFFREMVLKKKLLSLEEAIYKMTALPAKRLGLRDRGLLRPGYAADLLLLDPQRFTDLATFSAPKQLAQGLSLVLVNGKEAGAGKVLTRNTTQ